MMTQYNLPNNKDEYPRLLDGMASYSAEEQRVIMAEMGKADLFFFVVYILNRKDLNTDWHFDRMREIQEVNAKRKEAIAGGMTMEEAMKKYK